MECYEAMEWISEPYPDTLGFLCSHPFGWSLSVLPRKLIQTELAHTMRHFLEYQVWTDRALKNLEGISIDSETDTTISVRGRHIAYSQCLKVIEHSTKTLFRVIAANPISHDIVSNLSRSDERKMNNIWADIGNPDDRAYELWDMAIDMQRCFIHDWLSILPTLMQVGAKMFFRTGILIDHVCKNPEG